MNALILKNWTYSVARIFSFLILAVAYSAYAQEEQAIDRKIALISDTHMGLGKSRTGEWIATEDFRWPNALDGFLNYLSEWGKDNVTLVVVGDFLELWQRPSTITCEGNGQNLGCTPEEILAITTAVVEAHQHEFDMLSQFVNKGSNSLVILPGNHDAGLMLEPVWEEVSSNFGSNRDRITIVKDRVWMLSRYGILVEHGHQIGSDPNGFDNWPSVTEMGTDGMEYLVSSWGESFVQSIFNRVESEYQIIDNLSPSSAGAKYRIQDRSLFQNIKDIAKFISFNIFETSLKQKIAILGEEGIEGDQGWDVEEARNLGYLLFSESLSPTDPMRNSIEAGSEEGENLRAELDLLALDEASIPDSDISLLCDKLSEIDQGVSCNVTLGAALESLIPRQHVLRKHLLNRISEYGTINTFIYGHTHKYEEKWSLSVDSDIEISILNTGAFQRVMNDEQFRAKIERDSRYSSNAEALRGFTLEADFPPCYTFVLVDFPDQVANAKTWRWYMEENGIGNRVEPGSAVCEESEQID